MKKLTKDLAINEIIEIKKLIDDEEEAHRKEDFLYYGFVDCIAKGLYTESEIKEIAEIVISSREINFQRWRA